MPLEFRKLTLGPNGPKGRQYKDMEKLQAMDPAMFTATVVSHDVNDTRVLAVCGIPPEDSAPVEDGWFVSDSFAFKHVMSGIGKAQTWIACGSVQSLVYVFLHGNPYHDRKVVLNQEMVRKGFGADIVVVPESNVCDVFAEKLREEARQARLKNQPLVVLVFAHGYKFGGGWWLGQQRKNLFERARTQELMDQDVHGTIVSTACYGGQWAINTTFNKTVLPAAGPLTESESRNGSSSCDRKCGSIYASALLKAWREEADKAQSLQQNIAGPNTQTQITYHDFTEAVWDSLFSLDRFAHVHDIRSSAQNEDWAAGWSTRLGFAGSAISFEKKWDSLITVQKDASLAESSLNRDPALDVDLNDSNVLASKLNVRHGGNIEAARNQVCAIGSLYLQSFPGRSSLSSNTALHGKLNKVRDRSKEVDWTVLDTVLQGVSFRLESSHLATQLVQNAGMKLPNGLTCSQTDMTKLETRLVEENENKWMCIIQHVMGVLPDPSPELRQGADWPKPERYIAAAIFLSEGVNELDGVKSTVTAMKNPVF